jgi:hypothetical protein
MSEISVVQMTPEQLPALEKQMLADNHNVVMPTHVFKKGGDIIGSVSVGAAPLVWWWMDSKKAKALDSVRSIKKLEDVYRSNGIHRAFIVCDKGSNFFPYIERLGNKFMWETNIYYRDF